MTRIFRSKSFARWMRQQGLLDSNLIAAIAEMDAGKWDADLGGSVYKQRVALPNRGKSGGVRTLIAYQRGAKAFFMFGFAKSERGNVSARELRALKLAANVLLAKNDADLKKDLKAKILIEVEKNG
ncbi:MAG: type II toxin-antitoxin system RelE/ParE family toxin [Pseudomonadota bacterium]